MSMRTIKVTKAFARAGMCLLGTAAFMLPLATPEMRSLAFIPSSSAAQGHRTPAELQLAYQATFRTAPSTAPSITWGRARWRPATR